MQRNMLQLGDLQKAFGGHSQNGTLGDLAWYAPKCFHLKETLKPEISLCNCYSLSQGRWNSFPVLLCPKSTAVIIQLMRKTNHNYLYLHFALKEFKCKHRNISLKNVEAKEDKIT